MTPDPYSILELERDAPLEEIKAAYRRLARATHPDHNPEDPDAESKFRRVCDAYCLLRDPEARARYDEDGTDITDGGGALADGLRDLARVFVQHLDTFLDELERREDPLNRQNLNLVAFVRAAVARLEQAATEKVNRLEREAKAIDQVQAQVVYQGDELDILGALFRERLVEIRGERSEALRDLESYAAVRAILADYRWEAQTVRALTNRADLDAWRTVEGA
jgi:curved DNA-binding protein CbpA